MRQTLVMTLIGRDRPGLVESVAAIVDTHGGNWEQSRMVRLAGEFAGLLRIQVPAESAAELEAALSDIDGISVIVARAADEGPLDSPTTWPAAGGRRRQRRGAGDRARRRPDVR